MGALVPPIRLSAYPLRLGVSYAFTEEFQATVTTLLPVVSDMPTVLISQGKYVVSRSDRSVIAVTGNFNYFADSLDVDSDDDDDVDASLMTFGPGVLADMFLDDGGKFAVHGGLNISGVAGGSSDLNVADGALIMLDFGFSLRASSSIKIALEGKLPAAYHDGEIEVADAVLLLYGVRFHGSSLAADLAFMRPFGDVDTGDLVLGIPYVAFTARF